MMPETAVLIQYGDQLIIAWLVQNILIEGTPISLPMTREEQFIVYDHIT